MQIRVEVKSDITGRVASSVFTLKEIFENCGDDMVEEITRCDCQPSIESNVVECNCDDEWYGYKITLVPLV